jgi:hypothetical protein
MHMQHLYAIWGTKFHTSNRYWPLLIVQLSSLLTQLIYFPNQLVTGKSNTLAITFALSRSTINTKVSKTSDIAHLLVVQPTILFLQESVSPHIVIINY